MTTSSDTLIQTYTWRARGFTEDITVCDFCGRQELKGTVRMVALDADGDEGDELYAGVVCAAKRAGRKAAAIRHEAAAWDREARAAHNRWSDAKGSLTIELRDAWLADHGFDIRRRYPGLEVVCEALAAAAADPRMIAWLAANPAPVIR